MRRGRGREGVYRGPEKVLGWEQLQKGGNKLRSSHLLNLMTITATLGRLRGMRGSLMLLLLYLRPQGRGGCLCTRLWRFLRHLSYARLPSRLAQSSEYPAYLLCQNNGGPHPSALIGQQSLPQPIAAKVGLRQHHNAPPQTPLGMKGVMAGCLNIPDMTYTLEKRKMCQNYNVWLKMGSVNETSAREISYASSLLHIAKLDCGELREFATSNLYFQLHWLSLHLLIIFQILYLITVQSNRTLLRVHQLWVTSYKQQQ